jgi:hypothetical protein
MAMRTEMAALVADWTAAGGSESLPTVQERLKANNRPVQKPKAFTLPLTNHCRPERSMGLEGISTQTLLEVLEVPQRKRNAKVRKRGVPLRQLTPPAHVTG